MSSNPSILTDIMAEDVKEVKLNRAGAGYGFQGSNGVILIELKEPADYLATEGNNSKIKTSNIFSSKTTFGFTRSRDLFYKNDIIFNSQNAIEKYSAIDWIPNFILKPNSSNFIKIPKDSYEDISLIINGVNNEGKLVSEEINISFK